MWWWTVAVPRKVLQTSLRIRYKSIRQTETPAQDTLTGKAICILRTYNNRICYQVKNRTNPKHRGAAVTAVDLFCGVGGLTRGLVDAGIRVAAGYDIDTDCEYGYSHNNVGTKFITTSVTELTGKAQDVITRKATPEC